MPLGVSTAVGQADAPEACYLEYEIAFAVFRLVDVRTEAAPSFRSLFLEILQDLEKAKKHNVVERSLAMLRSRSTT